jgi:hypothetical protein
MHCLLQVLDSFPAPNHLEIICPADNMNKVQLIHGQPLSAVIVFLGSVTNDYLTAIATQCRWESIKSIQVMLLSVSIEVLHIHHLRFFHLSVYNQGKQSK